MTTVDVDQLETLLGSGAEHALLDVRETGEAHRGHVFGATFLPRRRIPFRIAELVPRRDTRIVVCDAGDGDGRAAAARAQLTESGYRDVVVLAGGIAAWVASGRIAAEGSNVPSKLFGERVETEDRVPHLDAPTLRRWQEEGRPHLVCDIRSPEEYARSRIPGARGAFGTELALLADDLRAAGVPVVVHCSGRTRSIVACRTLQLLGVDAAVALEDGTMGWTLAGFDVERGAGTGVLAPGAASAAVGERAARALGVAAGVEPVSAPQLAAWLAERDAGRGNVYAFDVRQVDRYRVDHVPGTVALPGGLAIQRADEFVAVRAGRIVFVDDGEARAWLAGYWFRRMGFARVHVLEGGQDGWRRAGWPLAVGRVRTPPLGWAQARATVEAVSAVALQAALQAEAARPDPARRTPVLFVDTGPRFRQARVPDSRWVPYGDLERRIAAWPVDARERLVLACADGVLSTLGAANLARAGLARARVLAGGVTAWREAGLAVASGDDPDLAGPADVVVQPYDAGRDAMARYLAWERQLVTRHAQPARHG